MASAASSLHAAAGSGNDRFNAEAAKWDANPFVHEASKHALEAIVQRFKKLNATVLDEKLDVLEIGCGTGLLSCITAPYAKRVVAVDAAEGMIEVLKKKLQQPDAPKNIYPVAVLLEDAEDKALPPADETDPEGRRMKFDLITSHLVLHHIPDLKAVLQTMQNCLKMGGHVALTDFEDYGPEAKAFHPQNKMPGVERHGINVVMMERLMTEVGFVNVKVERAWTMDKRVEKYEGEFSEGGAQQGQGVVRKFPFLVCMGEKKWCMP
jgi:2-polyprenyl-3-methyl-5-hydroxy-6-metoxy-1,4-benzoquinol methylase